MFGCQSSLRSGLHVGTISDAVILLCPLSDLLTVYQLSKLYWSSACYGGGAGASSALEEQQTSDSAGQSFLIFHIDTEC